MVPFAMRPVLLRLTQLWLALISAMATAASPDPRPNFIVLFADDQRADTIAAWGNRHIQTPHLDSLVRRGFGFRANYCAGSDSGAVCIPSRAMLMTGRMWMHGNHAMTNSVTFPAWFGERGWRTFATGKWHNGRSAFARSFQEGRSVFFGGMADHTRVPVVDFAHSVFSPVRTANRFSSEEFADAVIGFLRDAETNRPFLCHVAFTAPHDPRNPLRESVEPYYRKKPPLPSNFLPQHPFDNGWMRGLRDEDLAAYPRNPETIREQLAEYYGLISHLDSQVGRILEALAQSPHARNTYIVYAADHGLALGSHGLLGKQSLYEHSMRCPLIIAGPGIPAGRETRQFTYLYDLFPTLCGLAGIETPSGIDGRDLKPLWSDRPTAWRDSVFLAFTDSMRSIRDERWKLIVYPPTGVRQLFDLKSDPDERFNRAGQRRTQAVEDRLIARLLDAQRQAGDSCPLEKQPTRPAAIDLSRGYERKPDADQPAWIVEKYFGKARTLDGSDSKPEKR
jgi:arylsulfatase A-like enzyme